jgi:hypothetical protein
MFTALRQCGLWVKMRLRGLCTVTSGYAPIPDIHCVQERLDYTQLSGMPALRSPSKSLSL